MNTTFSYKNNKYDILTPNGFEDFEGINVLPKSYIFKITFEDNSIIRCSYNHIFVVDGISIKAIELFPGEYVIDADNKKKRIKEIIPDGSEILYDIAGIKSEDKTYITNNVVSHNCKFLGSTALLVDGTAIDKIIVKNPIRISQNDKFFIYEEPISTGFYVLGVDCGEGAKLDSSTIQVLKFNSERDVREVAVYKSNEIHPNAFAQIVVEVSRMYNEAFIMIENNAVGILVCNTIWNTIEYDKIVNTEKRGLGFKTTHKSKVAGNIILKRYMESGWLILCDKNTKRELSVFENAGENIWKASSGNHDDLVMGLSIALSFINTIYWDPSIFDNNSLPKQYEDYPEETNDNSVAYIDYSNITDPHDESAIANLFGMFQEGNT